uniref:Uncharacterized protein n=1 Tax=Candidozyma auris TaxID=498019 RepID=A0A0L0NSN1_CANAR
MLTNARAMIGSLSGVLQTTQSPNTLFGHFILWSGVYTMEQVTTNVKSQFTACFTVYGVVAMTTPSSD